MGIRDGCPRCTLPKYKKNGRFLVALQQGSAASQPFAALL